jgi:hypothetical protein
MAKNRYDRKPKLIADKSVRKDPFIVFSFRDFDRNQGQGFSEWQDEELLASMLEKLAGISRLTIGEVLSQQIIKIYSKVDFPPESAFKHPRHVSDDVNWASMHIQGKECIIGHF